ncbi:flavodoxin domain-containing protein [Winogradskyella sp.]|uniref:flavodoxin domain-containing protein n=1 Tax=Winogradskyella sp. TaxID=1883156 RepID=UPI0025D2375D|nr:flavodoxin domain-containing protein [Winogradskyella sp.]
MKGAIFFASKYGSTEQYANWIGEASGLPVFDVKSTNPNLADYDFLVLGSPIIYYKLLNRKWIQANWVNIENKKTILFTVSGAPAGKKLNRWIAESKLPNKLVSSMEHFALRGRQIPKELTWYDRLMLIIGALKNPNPVASKEELNGFDYMDKSSIEPILKYILQLQHNDFTAS